MFQSLFYWKYHFNMNSSRQLYSVKSVSSLFYWKYHFNTDMINKNINIRKFQSLFYWKYHFNQKNFTELKTYFDVSILVLLEVPLQLLWGGKIIVLPHVSILVLLEVPLQPIN